MRKFFSGIGCFLMCIYLAIIAFVLVGWGVNLYKIAIALAALGESIPTVLIFRIVGVLVFPIGAIMGWVV